VADCPKREDNLKMCTCTYSGCSKKGKCCECLHYHRLNGQLPACFFSAKDEKTYDRSVARFVAANS